jgi:uncharacterized sodium:solute symporter family permease YidK
MKFIMILGIVVVAGVVILAIIGYFKEREDRKLYEKFNKEQIQNFMNIKDAKKKKRQSTPKVPAIKK